MPQLRDRWLWTARYGSLQPIVPRTWARWDIWQFTDGDSGNVQRVPGVLGPCDCNQFRGALAELQALASQNNAPGGPAPPEPTAGAPPPFRGQLFLWPHSPIISGPDVRLWQSQVSQRGFSVAVDGFYGRQSRKACLAFQREMGLEPDGVVGQATWKATFEPT